MSKYITVKFLKDSIHGELELPGSKSLSNRAQIISALSSGKVKINKISDAEDSIILNKALSQETDEINIGMAGTAMRFLTAYLARKKGEFILTGDERMKERPIKILVDSLRLLGADIEYLENDGFPPLKIIANKLNKTHKISIPGNVSSQYISALLLIAPTLENGIELILTDEITSKPYIEMTLALLAQAGIISEFKEDKITIKNQTFSHTTLQIEPDWSAASYWYAMAALSKNILLKLKDLNGYSLQGDSIIAEVMANFGVTTEFLKDGISLKKSTKKLARKIFDLKDCPDLAQTIIVCCAALKHNATFTGLETLKIKETNRIQALQNELAKIGAQLTEKNKVYKLIAENVNLTKKVSFNTYNDHRMAMAFAPLALVMDEIKIENPDVVRKSYPNFWEDLKHVGFEIN